MNRIDLAGRVAVVVTGARRDRIRHRRTHARVGATVVLWDCDDAGLATARPALSGLGGVDAHVVELTDEASVNAATAAAMSAHGRIDILVNNAGITGGNGPTWALDPAVWRLVIEVNLIAPYLVCRAVVPQCSPRATGAS